MVIGLLDKNLSQPLQMKVGLDLQSAIEMARQAELVKSQLTEQASLEAKHLDEVQRRRNHQRRSSNRRCSTHQQYPRCNRKHDRDANCPAKGKKFQKCGKLGHFAVVCRTQPAAKVGEVSENADTVSGQPWEEIFFLGSISCSDAGMIRIGRYSLLLMVEQQRSR